MILRTSVVSQRRLWPIWVSHSRKCVFLLFVLRLQQGISPWCLQPFWSYRWLLDIKFDVFKGFWGWFSLCGRWIPPCSRRISLFVAVTSSIPLLPGYLRCLQSFSFISASVPSVLVAFEPLGSRWDLRFLVWADGTFVDPRKIISSGNLTYEHPTFNPLTWKSWRQRNI